MIIVPPIALAVLVSASYSNGGKSTPRPSDFHDQQRSTFAVGRLGKVATIRTSMRVTLCTLTVQSFTSDEQPLRNL
jgi:hypothetical protein